MVLGLLVMSKRLPDSLEIQPPAAERVLHCDLCRLRLDGIHRVVALDRRGG